MTLRRSVSFLSLVCAGVLSVHCGSSSSDAAGEVTKDAGTDAKVDSGAETGGECGFESGDMDCFDPCSGDPYSPSCIDGSWRCDDVVECPDSGPRCEPDGNAVPVSCDPFPETTVCDPFGVWSLAYETEYPGMCAQSAIDSVSIERGTDGIVRVAFGDTATATLSTDGCSLEVTSVLDWTNPSENGTVTHSLTLSFAGADAGDGGDTASGVLTYSENGFCNGSGTTNATATRLSN